MNSAKIVNICNLILIKQIAENPELTRLSTLATFFLKERWIHWVFEGAGIRSLHYRAPGGISIFSGEINLGGD